MSSCHCVINDDDDEASQVQSNKIKAEILNQGGGNKCGMYYFMARSSINGIFRVKVKLMYNNMANVSVPWNGDMVKPSQSKAVDHASQ